MTAALCPRPDLARLPRPPCPSAGARAQAIESPGGIGRRASQDRWGYRAVRRLGGCWAGRMSREVGTSPGGSGAARSGTIAAVRIAGGTSRAVPPAACRMASGSGAPRSSQSAAGAAKPVAGTMLLAASNERSGHHRRVAAARPEPDGRRDEGSGQHRHVERQAPARPGPTVHAGFHGPCRPSRSPRRARRLTRRPALSSV